jgi:tetratricopeptide (TPR) repeat protein
MQAGRVVADRFVIERLAGSGGMGSVYLASDRARTGRPVALKTLGPNADATRFAREISTLSELTHPSIVRFVAHGTVDGAPFLAMEWLEGEDLASRLARGSLSVRECVGLATCVGEALGHAHARGVVHRDVKPSNIFLPTGNAEDARLLDFGIARSDDAIELTRTGAVVGTPGYMAPEQARGNRALDPCADVFALGCVLFECLAGRPAFAGPNVMAVLARVLLEEAPRVSELRKDVPAVLDELIARMLAKDPTERPADGNAIASALDGLSPTLAPVAVAAPSAVGAGELRFVTVILAGAPSLDAAMRDTLPAAGDAKTLDVVRGALAPLDARIVSIQGGAIACVLSQIASATDQARHAAHGALRIHAARPDVRVAVASGRAQLAGHLALGEAIDRAAEMVAALPGDIAGIRLDELTAGLLGPELVVGGDAGGLSLLGERDADESPRTLLGRETPCVGREKELAYFRGLFDECTAESVARAALVTAPAGAGKSRLRQELARGLTSQAEVLQARGDAFAAGSPLGLVARLVRRACGLFAGEPVELQVRKLRARVARNVPPEHAMRVASFLGEITGSAFPDAELAALRAARADPRLMGDSTRAALSDFFYYEASARPLALLLEDLHWADAASVEYVQAALQRLTERPFFVLAFARDAVHERFPSLWRGAQEIKLAGLGARAAERLTRAVLGDAVDDAALKRITERAGGNAFYLEELIRAQSLGVTDAMPATIMAMAQSRFDALDAGDRRLLRAASVFGDAFWRGAVGELLGEAPGRALDARFDALVEREVIFKKSAARFIGETELSFRHALVREAAYAALTDADRTAAHRLAADWLESAGERDPMTLAGHHEQGGSRERAAEWYRRAAEQALERDDLAGALERADRSEACGASGETKGAILLVRAFVHDWRGENAAAARVGREAIALLPRSGAHWHRAIATVAAAFRRMGDRDGLIETAREALSLGAESRPGGVELGGAARIALQLIVSGNSSLGRELLDRIARFDDVLETEPVAWAWARAAKGMAALFAGDPSPLVVDADAMVARAEDGGDLRSVCNIRFYVGAAAQSAADLAMSERHLSEAVALSERLGLWTLRMISRKELAGTLILAGRALEARDLVIQAIEESRAQGDAFQECTAFEHLASVRAAEGDLVEAERAARKAVELMAAAPPFQAGVLATLSRILLATGRPAEALEVAERAANAPRGLRDAQGTLAKIEALLANGRADEARDFAREGHRRVIAASEKLTDRAFVAAFLALPLHAAIARHAGE